MPIVTRSDNQRAPWLMIYGDDGTGKTTQAAGFSWAAWERTKKPALYCSWDPDGEQSIPSWVPIELWTPSAGANPLDEAQETIVLALSGKYSAYVIDTTSAFSERVLKYVLKARPEVKRAKVGTAAGPVGVPDKGDYGAAAACINNWVANTFVVREKGVPLLMVAHSRFIQAEDGEDQAVDTFGGPAFIGKALTREMARWPAFIGRIVPYVEADGKAGLWMKVSRDGWWSAKDRMEALPNAGVSLTKGVNFSAGREAQTKSALERSRDIWNEVLGKHAAIMNERKKLAEAMSATEAAIKSDGESAAKETTA